MLQALREIEGGISLSLNVAARLPSLRKAPILESFLRQVYFTGVTASTGVVLRATMLGVLIIAVLAAGLAQIGVQEPTRRLVTGAVIVVAAIVDYYRTRR